MPWSNNTGGGPWGGGGRGNSGGGGGGQSPWGRGPAGGGGGGRPPPDVEDMIRKSQERLKRMLPGGLGGKGIALVVSLVLVFWLATGFYQVDSNEEGVELVFGQLHDRTGPGLHYNWPAPIGEVLLPKVTDVNQEQIGFRAGIGGTQTGIRNVPQESLMLTGDENIIDIQAAIFWVIADAPNFLFNVRNPQETVRNVSEAAIREVVGKTNFEFARTQGRGEVAAQVQELIQAILDEYQAGILVTNVQLQKIDPPAAVIDAFRDVQAARADAERAINEATAYLNEVTARAEGQASQIVQAAEAYRQEKVAAASGDSDRFVSIYNEYSKAQHITKRRIYLETMERVLGDMNKILIDDDNGRGSGVLPYLPLDRLNEMRRAPVQQDQTFNPQDRLLPASQ